MLLTVLAAPPPRVAAHPQYSAATINRYAKLVLEPGGRLRLIYTVMVGDWPALGLRQQADQDHDGRLDDRETQALARRLREVARAQLHLTLDHDDVPLRFDEPAAGLAGDQVAPAALSVDLTFSRVLPVGPAHTLRFEDELALAPEGEQEVIIDPGPGVRVLASFQGVTPPSPAEPVLRFLSQGERRSLLSDRSVTVSFQEEAPAAGWWSRGRAWLRRLSGRSWGR